MTAVAEVIGRVYQVLFTGDQRAGKTAIVSQFGRASFPATYHRTIGMEFVCVHTDSHMWDLAGVSGLAMYLRCTTVALWA